MCALACAVRYIQPSVCSAGPGASRAVLVVAEARTSATNPHVEIGWSVSRSRGRRCGATAPAAVGTEGRNGRMRSR